MNYELAKQLKDAGFPSYKFGVLATHDEKLLELDWQTYKDAYTPTLSELIEACGKEIIAPNRNTKERKPISHLFRLGWGDEWFANYEFYNSYVDNGYGLPICEYGSTPEEAVAKLWLEINKK